MKILVTGVAGAIGSHVAEHFARQEECLVEHQSICARIIASTKKFASEKYDSNLIARYIKGKAFDKAFLLR